MGHGGNPGKVRTVGTIVDIWRVYRLYAVLGLAGLVAAAYLGLQTATRLALAEGSRRAEATLALTVQALDGHLRRFEHVPTLLAENDAVRRALAAPGDGVARHALNRWLYDKQVKIDALDIYVMTPDGLTIAASNHARAESFIGQNFSYRPYFQGAVQGGLGRYYAVGTTSGVRGYYFAAPARNTGGRIIGVVVVKVGLDAIEAEWRQQEAQIVVTDPEGIVFLSSQPGWLFRGLLPLDGARLGQIVASRRYADQTPQPLDHSRRQIGAVRMIGLAGEGGARHDYVTARQLLARVGWTVHVLQDAQPFFAQARLRLLAGAMALGVVLALGVMAWQRRARLVERLAMQEQAKIELEQRVLIRTEDLARVNKQMQAEVGERRATEAELRRTQKDLIQAGKLAALGQMSAALSHEINQPLTAARNFADSATILIERGQLQRARENLGQIISLIDRMATIARHLRHVARKPDAELKPIDLPTSIAEAVALLGQRLDHIALQIDLPPALPAIMAGPIRLQQVLVNLLSNAADAVTDVAAPKITLAAKLAKGRVQLSVQDNGKGVPAAIIDRIFDPFFTTKEVGSGLGLGLSISYNIMKDFGGHLKVGHAPKGGAIFTLDFAPATAPKQGPA
jgi:two-component system, NtrC family, C4-dicarboxylate transport sensor histidine kinase DctB